MNGRILMCTVYSYQEPYISKPSTVVHGTHRTYRIKRTSVFFVLKFIQLRPLICITWTARIGLSEMPMQVLAGAIFPNVCRWRHTNCRSVDALRSQQQIVHHFPNHSSTSYENLYSWWSCVSIPIAEGIKDGSVWWDPSVAKLWTLAFIITFI